MEALVSALILAVVCAGAGAAIAGGVQTTGASRTRNVAANLASQDIAQLRAMGNPTQVTPITTAVTRTVSGRTFTLTRSVTGWALDASGNATQVTGTCTANHVNPSYVDVVTTVTSTSNTNAGKASVSVGTRFAC